MEGRQQAQIYQASNPAGEILLRLKSVFPFDLFPNEIIIHRSKIDVVYRQFFWDEQVVSLPIDQIKGVSVRRSPIFGNLSIDLIGQSHQIRYLKVAEAYQARRIICGLIIFHQEKIDLSHLSIQQLINKLEEIGRAGTTSYSSSSS